MGRFDQRTVIVTGASLGVGLACAQHFHREGANVVLVWPVARARSRKQPPRSAARIVCSPSSPSNNW